MPPSVSAFAGRLVRHLAAWREGGGAHRRCVDPGGLEDVYLQDLVPIRYTAAEQAAAAGDLVGVRTSVREVLADDRTAVMSPVVLPLLEVVARTEADHTRSGRTDPDPAAGSWTLDRVRHFLALLPPANPRDRAYVAHVEAELLRHEGTDDTGTWSDVVDRWRETPMPYHLARALLRFADAAAPTDQRPAAVAAAKEAASIAERLDADPLRQAASSIGRRVGLHLGPSAPGRGLELLTSRELEVLQLLAGGASNAEVAEALVISPKTVAVHVSHILAKLGATSRGAAVATALRTGIARLDDLGPSPTGTAITGS
jgi:DNA-binding CsgD family transcriptional regulator